MSLSFLDLRDMESEMETTGANNGGGGIPGTETFAARLCFQGAGWSAAQLDPTLDGIWAEQAPSRYLPSATV